VNHVVVVDFGSFRELIDKLGGITIHLDKPIQSNRFDCPSRRSSSASSGRAGASRRGTCTSTGGRR